jgi:hypothetical protein
MTSLRSYFHLTRRSAALTHCLRRERNIKPDVSSLFCSQNQFIHDEAKRALPREECQKDVAPILSRPFDRTWTVYSRYVAVDRRERMTKYLLGHKRQYGYQQAELSADARLGTGVCN